jgi:hypothetical protein
MPDIGHDHTTPAKGNEASQAHDPKRCPANSEVWIVPLCGPRLTQRLAALEWVFARAKNTQESSARRSAREKLDGQVLNRA